MNERRIILLILSVAIYSLYSIHVWYVTDVTDNTKVNNESSNNAEDSIKEIHKNLTELPKKDQVRKKFIIPFIKNACSVFEVFTKKPPVKCKENNMRPEENGYNDSPTITVIGITIFLVVLAINAVLDVLKVKEEERVRRKNNPDGLRRQSLAEFANKKPLRRDSSKFTLQLFQITESIPECNDEKKDKRQTRTYTRGDSTNSYLSERKLQNDGMAPFCSGNDTPTGDGRLTKRPSVSKLFGARPVPMVRRSSFPVLPLNPEVQAMMLHGHVTSSTDSDEEMDGRARRVRLIRRY